MTGADLRDWRDRLKLTNRAAAEMLGLTPKSFENQIYGKGLVSKRTAALAVRIEGERE